MRNILKLQSGTQSGTAVSVKKWPIFRKVDAWQKIQTKVIPKKSIEKKRIFRKIVILDIFPKMAEFLGILYNFQEILYIRNRMFPCRS